MSDIDTGNAKPIKQRAYRTSHHQHKEIEKRVKETQGHHRTQC